VKKLVLGSGSPRRREILTSLGVSFVVLAADANEDVAHGESPAAYLERVVIAKLAAVRARLATRADVMHEAAAILVADTSVVCPVRGDILGKPSSDDDALAMLMRLSGRTHDVHTRFAIASCEAETAPLHAETVTTQVTFRALSEDEAHAYVATHEGIDKAGGYALQGRGMAFVPRIDGSYTNVVGLPACELWVSLTRLALACSRD
jgi:septum formation protein